MRAITTPIYWFFYREHKENFAYVAERDPDTYQDVFDQVAVFDPQAIVITHRLSDAPIDCGAAARLTPKTTVAMQHVKVDGCDLWRVFTSVGDSHHLVRNYVTLTFAYLFDMSGEQAHLAGKYALTLDGGALSYAPIGASPKLGAVEVVETHKMFKPTDEAPAAWYDAL